MSEEEKKGEGLTEEEMEAERERWKTEIDVLAMPPDFYLEECLLEIMQRRIDPKSKLLGGSSRWLVRMLWPRMFPEHEGNDEEPPEDYEKSMGALVLRYLRNEPEEELELLFAELLKMRRLALEPPRREAYAWMALRDYWKQVGRPPSKRELRKFMEARRETYREQPSPDRPWADLWKESGLNDFWNARREDAPLL